MLYIVGTPIGNLEDISLRAISILNEVDIILCEDTRVAKVLTSKYNIKPKLVSYHKFNEHDILDKYMTNLNLGMNLALITDSGMPLISDPGYLLVRGAIENSIDIKIIPGPTAFVSSLILSGIPADKFLFYGFLPSQISKRKKELMILKDFPYTIIFYESSNRILESLRLMSEIFKDRNVSISRELTKKYEETLRFNLKDLNNIDVNFKGELVIVVEGHKVRNVTTVDILTLYNEYIKLSSDQMQSVKLVAKELKIPKNIVYNMVMKKK